MSKSKSLQLYHQHYTAKGFERLGLFQLLADAFPIRRALYPGSFLHITPSLVFPVTCYVELDRRAATFFTDPAVHRFVNRHKSYPQAPRLTFHAADYRDKFSERQRSFDLLVSLYAGFVSRHCRRYLKIGGWLLANDSHGDASLASLSRAFRLVAAIQHSRGRYRLTTNDLRSFFVPKSGMKVTPAQIEKLGRGLKYAKAAAAYVFRRVQ